MMISNHEFTVLEMYVHAVAAKSVAQVFKSAQAEKNAKDIEDACRGYLTGKVTFMDTMKILDDLNKEQN